MTMGEPPTPSPADYKKHKLIDELLRLRGELEQTFKASRERSLVTTKLDEAIMWAARAEVTP